MLSLLHRQAVYAIVRCARTFLQSRWLFHKLIRSWSAVPKYPRQVRQGPFQGLPCQYRIFFFKLVAHVEATIMGQSVSKSWVVRYKFFPDLLRLQYL